MDNKLLKRIEGLRTKLNKYAVNRNLVDHDVVRISQQLDGLLNQYQRAITYQQLSFW